MKKLRLIVFATMLSFVLIIGQPHVTVADTSKVNQSLIPNELFSDEKFSVEITYVGASVLEELELSADGTYQLITDSFVPRVVFKVNISGWTTFQSQKNSAFYNSTRDSDASNDKGRLIGQLFFIVNGLVTSITGTPGFLGSTGAPLSLERGDNTVTFLYMGMDDVAGLKWASDTVIVRVGATEAELDDGFDTFEIPVTFEVSDAAVTRPFTEKVNRTVLSQNQFAGIAADIIYSPPMNITYTFESASGSKITVTGGNFLDAGKNIKGGNLLIAGTIDSTGFDGNQSLGTNITSLLEDVGAFNETSGVFDPAPGHFDRSATIWDPTIGNVFLFDANGTHLLNSSAWPTNFNATMISSNSGDQITSRINLVVFSDYGRWDVDQGFGGPDWDGLDGAYDSECDSTGCMEIDPFFWGSFDFAVNSAGLGVISEGAEIQETITQTEVTGTQTSTTTNRTPGFGALVSLISVGAIAYVAPRMRKTEE